MNENLLLVFIILNATNVVIQTIKSLVTIKCGKLAAATINAIAYGLYSVVVIYMVCDLPLLWKAGIIAICNFIGVFIVKWAEEKLRKDKLWKVEATIKPTDLEDLKEYLDEKKIPFNYIDLQKYVLINAYCETQKQSLVVKEALNAYKAKYFVSESKEL